MYENFAIKYRPKNFGEVVGQDVVVRTISNSLKMERIAHAYLFFGPRGCGKTTVARILAKSLNCHKPKNHLPCDKCSSCLEISGGKSLDVLEIDAASNTQVDKVRETIIEHIDISPSRDKYKIYILDEVHMLSNSAFNALLKTIEEPPPHVIFMMATTEQSKVPVTMVSRCQNFRFRLISKDLILASLKEVLKKEKIKIPKDNSLELISEASGGAMRDALTVLDRCVSYSGGELNARDAREVLGFVREDLMEKLAVSLADKDASGIHECFREIAREGYDAFTVLRDLRETFADAFLLSRGFSKGNALSEKISSGRSPALLAKISRNIAVIIDEIRFSDSPDISAEVALFTLTEKTVDLDALVRELEGIRKKIESPEFETAFGDEESKKKTEIKPESALPAKKRPAGSKKLLENPLPRGEIPVSGEKREKSSYPPDGNNTGIWKKMLDGLYEAKPILYNVLASMKIIFSGEDRWEFMSSSRYDVDMVMAEGNRNFIEGELSRISGREIKIDARIGEGEEEEAGYMGTEHFGRDGAPRDDEESESVRWEDISGGEEIVDPELKHLGKFFKIKRITRLDKK